MRLLCQLIDGHLWNINIPTYDPISNNNHSKAKDCYGNTMRFDYNQIQDVCRFLGHNLIAVFLSLNPSQKQKNEESLIGDVLDCIRFGRIVKPTAHSFEKYQKMYSPSETLIDHSFESFGRGKNLTMRACPCSGSAFRISSI